LAALRAVLIGSTNPQGFVRATRPPKIANLKFSQHFSRLKQIFANERIIQA
jgi:hypothetical protein